MQAKEFEPKEVETYVGTIHCLNCGFCEDLNIPKGTSVVEFIKDLVCKCCKCYSCRKVVT